MDDFTRGMSMLRSLRLASEEARPAQLADVGAPDRMSAPTFREGARVEDGITKQAGTVLGTRFAWAVVPAS